MWKGKGTQMRYRIVPDANRRTWVTRDASGRVHSQGAAASRAAAAAFVIRAIVRAETTDKPSTAGAVARGT
jgi:hypothetical protein